MPENQRKVVGLQATAREWRRTECFKIISDQRKKLADSREVVANSPDFQNPLRDGSNSVDIRREDRKSVV